MFNHAQILRRKNNMVVIDMDKKTDLFCCSFIWEILIVEYESCYM